MVADLCAVEGCPSAATWFHRDRYLGLCDVHYDAQVPPPVASSDGVSDTAPAPRSSPPVDLDGLPEYPIVPE